MTIPWEQLRQLTDKYQKFVLLSHVRPDCDALGSELGLAGVLRALGKDVIISNADPVPDHLDFIDPNGEIKVLGKTITEEALSDREVFVVLDTSAWVQLGSMGDLMKKSNAQKVVIDHHVGNDDLGAILLKNEKAEATGRLIVEAAEYFGVEITPEMADPLFMAVATDTGWFRFGSVGSETYRIAAKLVEAGSKPDKIYEMLYEQNTVGRIQLRGRILNSLQTYLEGALITMRATQEDFKETASHPSDTEDVINLGLTITGTRVALIFIEQSDGNIKVSFRSRCDFDCSAMAQRFNGGGHKKASGTTLPGPLEKVEADVLAEATKNLSDLLLAENTG
ncbi:MAG: bifunctional oligoribonuclease/PAP phosphatase NrnA [Pirellulaceae bacterium]|nr:bifunctional oligoribonuclease/PAP phosphatase NrnA [Pirellulaceae bacterium]